MIMERNRDETFSVAVFIFVTMVIILIVTTGILVSIFFEEELAKLTLICLIALTIILGLLSLLVLELHRRQYTKRLAKQISRNTSWAYSRSTTIEA
ncbi:hypothetical protein WA026_022667 [Henosepilachna vigintioctopunctata]|uniref:Uncharacterized protein n=1 Tax=Henosepilachna vigintioctopunctata TaxID=420089 RepID=A0AAW1TXW1_9CUCU